ncbi:1962_t:CDS:10, partial [Acaulospora colombiana]
NLIFKYLQNVCIGSNAVSSLYLVSISSNVFVIFIRVDLENKGADMGFDEFMNLVLDNSEEVNTKKKTRKALASLNFSASNARVKALLKSSPTHKTVREAAPHERKLFTLVEELGTTPRVTKFSNSIREELEQPTPLRGPDPVTVDKLLRAANDAKEQIELLAQRHEEITSSIDSLESIMEKQRIKLEKVKIAERVKGMDHGTANDETLNITNEKASKFDDEIRHHEMEILALDMLKQEYINKINSLNDELEEQKRKEAEEIELNQRLGSLVLNEESDEIDEFDELVTNQDVIDRMKLLEFKREILLELDTQLEELEEIASQKVDDSEFGRLKFKIQSILKRTDMVDTISTLEQLLEDHQNGSLLEFDIDIINEISSTLIESVAEAVEKRDIYLDKSIPMPSQQMVLCAIILQILRDAGGELPLADLKERIGQSAREKGWKDSDGINALYILVANFLVTFNHSRKGCPVTAHV